MKRLIGNIKNSYDFYKNYKKTTMILVSIFAVFLYGLFYRVPNMVKCMYEAKFIQSIEDDNWRFRMIPSNMSNQCQYRLNKRWIPLLKPATDVGIDDMDFGH